MAFLQSQLINKESNTVYDRLVRSILHEHIGRSCLAIKVLGYLVLVPAIGTVPSDAFNARMYKSIRYLVPGTTGCV